MALNPIAFTEKVVRSFLRYQGPADSIEFHGLILSANRPLRAYSPAAARRWRTDFGGSDTTRSPDAASFFLKSSTMRAMSNPKAAA